MKRSLAGFAAASLLAGSGCFDFKGAYDDCFERGVCLEDGTRRLGPPSATVSSVEVSRSVGVAADGVDEVQISVHVRDAEGNGLPGLAVTLDVSGSNDTVVQPPATDAAGAALGTLRSTTAELKIVSATIGGASPLKIASQPSVRFEAGAAAKLSFLVEPSAAQAGELLSPAVRVEVVDGHGNRVGTATHPVTLSIASGPGGAALAGTTTVNAVSGVATFSSLALNKPGAYELAASALGLASAQSQPFDVTLGRPSALAFLSSPGDVVAGGAIPDFQVALLDTQGNLMTTASDLVTVGLIGAGTATVAGSTLVPAIGGIATFSALSIQQAGKGYVLAASAPGYAATLSASFDVLPGPASAAKSTLVAAPPTALADGLDAINLTATVVDDFYNPISGASVTFAATGADNVLVSPADPTGADGSAAGSIRSKGIGPKTLSAKVAAGGGPPLELSTTVTVAFTVPPPVVQLDLPTAFGNCLAIHYAVQQTQSLPVDVTLEFDPDGAGVFHRMTQAGGAYDGVEGLGSSSFSGGRDHSFLWNSTADLPRRLMQSVSIRIVASARGVASNPALVAGIALDNGIALAAPRVSQAAGSYANYIVADDFDRDGDADVALFGSGGATGQEISLMLGNGDALTTGPAIPIVSGAGIVGAFTADFNHDGLRDLAYAQNNAGSAYVSLGGGADLLQAPVAVALGWTARALAPGDLDRDGNEDLLAATPSGLVALLGDGSGGFPTLLVSPLSANVHRMVAADFDGDGILDAVTSHWDNAAKIGALELRLGNGDGTFGSAVAASLALSYDAGDMQAGDLDGDGVPDLVFVGPGADVTVVLGVRGGGFAAPASYPAVSMATQLRLGDLNGDGVLDVVVTRSEYNGMTVFAGKGDGTLDRAQPYIAGFYAAALAIADATGDGRPDVILGHGYVKDVTLFANATAPPCERRWPALAVTPLTGFVSGNPPSPGNLAIGDFNRDGKPDVAVADSSLKMIHLLNGLGNGGFANEQRYPTGNATKSLRAADLDGDGIADLVSANDAVSFYLPDATGSLTVLRGLSDGTFRFWDELLLDGRADRIAIADVTGDGRPDFVVPTARNGATEPLWASALASLPDGTFGPQVKYPLLAGSPAWPAYGAELADVNGDGVLDFVSANAGEVAILQGDGAGLGAPQTLAISTVKSLAAGPLSGASAAKVVTGMTDGTAAVISGGAGGRSLEARAAMFPVAAPVDAVTLPDLDGDGAPEIVAFASGRLEVSAARYSAASGFSAAIRSAAPSGTAAVAPADVDGDGRPDLVFSTSSSNLQAVGSMLGNGDLSFGGMRSVSLPATPTGLAGGDFDGDGRGDLVATTAATARVVRTTADGSLVAMPAVTGAYDLRGVAAGDFDRDGLLDAVAVDAAGGARLRFFGGDGAGGLSAKASSPGIALASGDIASVRAADVNLDGKLDLLATSPTSAGLFLGIGDGTFTAVALPIPSGRSSAVADVDRDGKPDALSLLGTSIVIAFGDGLGGFPRTELDAVSSSTALAVADVDRDGQLEILVRSATTLVVYRWMSSSLWELSRVAVRGDAQGIAVAQSAQYGYPDVFAISKTTGLLSRLTSQGFDSYGEPSYFALDAPLFLVAADFNHDGHLDLAVGLDGAISKSVGVMFGR